MKSNKKLQLGLFFAALVGGLILNDAALARDIEYQNQEFSVYVNPGEPTQIQFPGSISGGFRKKQSSVSLERKGSDLIVFANEALSDQGEALIVRLEDGQSYSMRLLRSNAEMPRDDLVRILDNQASYSVRGEEEPAHKEKTFEYAPPSQVSGLMREMVLNAEFGKRSIAGYKISSRHKGQTVLNDGTLLATIDRIYMGPNLWGYVLDTENMLDETQKINPATFRLDGTRAVTAADWELAPRPMDLEQQISGKHKTKLYIVTKAK